MCEPEISIQVIMVIKVFILLMLFYLALLTLKRMLPMLTLRDVPSELDSVTPPGMAREDWKIIRALSEVTTSPVIVIMFLCSAQIAGYTLAYEELEEVRQRLSQIAPHLLTCGDLQPANYFALAHKMMKVHVSYKFRASCKEPFSF